MTKNAHAPQNKLQTVGGGADGSKTFINYCWLPYTGSPLRARIPSPSSTEMQGPSLPPGRAGTRGFPCGAGLQARLPL